MSTQPVLFVQGSKETLKSFRGARYRSINYAAIVDLVRSPAARPKSSAPAIIPSSFLGHDGRVHQVQRDFGSFQFLCADIDAGNPSLEPLASALTHVIGNTCFLIYSTSSAKPVARKWRVLIPLAAAIPGRDYTAVASRFYDLMGAQGIVCDPALARTGQLVYLPNVPPDRRDGGRPDGAPLFYRFEVHDGPLFNPAGLLPLPPAPSDVAAENIARPSTTTPASTSRVFSPAPTGRDTIPAIERYNRRHPLFAELIKYGFKSVGNGNWQSPYQRTGFATTVLGQRWYSLSTNDAVMGRPAVSGGTFGDAFDLLVHFDFNGDFAAALSSISDEPELDGFAPSSLVKFPGPADQPLVLALGRKDAEAIHEVMGLEVWSLDEIAKIKTMGLAPDRKVILALPDYRRNSPAYNNGRTAARALRKRGLELASITPWSPSRGDSSGFYDLMAQEGDAAVVERFRNLLSREWSRRTEVPLAVGAQKLEAVISGFFSTALTSSKHFARALKASVGIGKTHTLLREARDFLIKLRANGDTRVVAIAVPHHRLSDQNLDDFKKLGGELRAAVWRGREANDPSSLDGKPMCLNFDAVREAEKVLADVEAEICQVCPHRRTCSYLAQSQIDADLWIVAHQSIFNAPPRPIAECGIAALAIDESFYSAGLMGIEEPVRVALDALEPGAMPLPEEEADYLVAARSTLLTRLHAAPDGPVRLGALTGGNKSLFVPMTSLCSGLEMSRKINSGPLKERLPNATIIPMQAVWRTIAEIDLRDTSQGFSGRLWIDRDPKSGVRHLNTRTRKPIAKKWRVPTLLLDATLEIELVWAYLPDAIELPEITVEAPFQRIIQATDRAFGKSAVLAEKGKPPRALLQTLRSTSMALERQFPADILVAGHKATIEALNLPPRISTSWFNGVAGRNDWETVSAIVIISRPLPPPKELEAMAGALTGHHVAPVGEWYPLADVQRLVRRGDRIEVLPDSGDWHPDSTVRALMRAIAVGQVVQTIGRGRGIRRLANKTLTIFLLTNVPLPIPVDEVTASAALLANGPREEQLATAGIAFAEPGAAARAYPDLFKSPEAAKKAFQREKSGTFPCEEPITGKCPPLRFLSYRLAGQGQRPAQVVIDVRDQPFPRDVIEDRLGPIAEMTRYWQIGDGRLVPAGRTVADMPRDEREPITRFLDIMSAYADLLRSPNSELTKADAAAFMTRWLTDAMEWQWTAPELFGSQGRDGIIRMLEGRAIVELGERAIELEGGDTLMRPPPLRP